MVDLVEGSPISNSATKPTAKIILSPEIVKTKKIKKKSSTKVKKSKNSESEVANKKSSKKQSKTKTQSQNKTPEKVAVSSDTEEPVAKKVKVDGISPELKTKSPKNTLKKRSIHSDTENPVAIKTQKNGVTSKAEESKEKTPDLKIDENSPEVLGAFTNFPISEETQRLLLKKGVKYLFPIQVKSFNHVYEGKDVVAQARTGTGKTLSFALPLVEKLSRGENRSRIRGRGPKVLVMAPTRELALQVQKDFDAITTKLRSVCIYGGTSYYPQTSALNFGVDIVVGTPGRLLDLLNKSILQLGEVDHVVLDEVDQMLDMGFAESVEEILSFVFTDKRTNIPQTLLFSATCPDWVYQTARKYMRPDETVHVDTIGNSTVRTATTVKHLSIRCLGSELMTCVADVVNLYSGQQGRAIIFTATKRGAQELSMSAPLKRLKAQALHGDVQQKQRELTLKAFRDGKIHCLVATDVASRGLDIPEVDLVIQTSPPQDIDSYIHRSGRTGRAGRAGVCVCFYTPQEAYVMNKVEKTAGIKFERVGPPRPDFLMEAFHKDAASSMLIVKKPLIKLFRTSAEDMASKFEGDATAALAAAMAIMSGASSCSHRSALTCKQNRVTWVFQCDHTINGPAHVYKTMEESTNSRISKNIYDLTLTANCNGAVFDLPSYVTEEVESLWKDLPHTTLTQATVLPPLMESGGPRSGGFGRGGRSGGFGGGGRSGGFGRNGRGGSNRGGQGKRRWGNY